MGGCTIDMYTLKPKHDRKTPKAGSKGSLPTCGGKGRERNGVSGIYDYRYLC